MAKDTPVKLSLSMDTWVKIGLVLFVQGAILLGVAWRMSIAYESRLTILETNQKNFMTNQAILMEIVKGKHL